jgi:hypothetical protein
MLHVSTTAAAVALGLLGVVVLGYARAMFRR